MMALAKLYPQSWISEPIKVLVFSGDYLFVGEGSRLHVIPVNHPDDKNRKVIKAFREEWPITNISCRVQTDGIHFFITSLYSYRKGLFHLDTDELKLYSETEWLYGEIMTGHYLQDGSFLIYDLNNHVLLNEVTRPNEPDSFFKGIFGAPDCVTIFGEKLDEILLFVATSSTVNICKLRKREEAGDPIREIHPISKFSQTKGIIFSVKFYPKSNLIITTSDDRSVSLWNYDSVLSVKLKATLEGHTSRVFDAVLLNDEDYVVSVAEDSTIVMWLLADLTCHHVIGSHGGCNIWSCVNSHSSLDVYTCGDNGSIFRWELQKCITFEDRLKPVELLPAWSIDSFVDVESSMSRGGSPLRLNDFPRLVKFFNLMSSVVTTDFGKILIVDDKKVLDCKEDPTWKAYMTIAVSPDKDMFVIGSLNGSIFYNMINSTSFTEETFKLDLPKPEKVMSVHFLSQSELIVSTITSLLKYVFTRIENHIETFPEINFHWSVKQKSNVNCIEKFGNVIYTGLDNGKIKAYDRTNGRKLFEFKARHNKFGVGGIIEYRGQLVTGGRDAKLNFFFIGDQAIEESCSGTELVMHLKTQPLPFLWVGKFLKYKDDLLVCGFESTDFIIFSLKREQVIGRTNCGGAHRSWDFFISNTGTGSFSHVRSRKVYKTCFELDQYVTNCIKEGFHLDDINSVVQVPTASDTCIILATGSEDSCVKISSFSIQHVETSRRKEVNAISFVKETTETICNHSSAVRCLHYQAMKNSMGYLISGGGRSEIFITKVYIEGHVLKKYENIRRFCMDSELDFRVMDMKSILIEDENASSKLIVFAACSDGFLRLVSESGNQKFSRNYIKAMGTTHCLTTVEILEDQSSSNVLVFSGTSAGEIVMWNLNFLHQDNNTIWDYRHSESTITPQRVVVLDVMSITALEVLEQDKCKTITLLIGGDDGSLQRISGEFFQHEKIDVIEKKMSNDGILGLQKHKDIEDSDSEMKIYFISGGKFYKCDLNLENISRIEIPIKDGKGITICTPIRFCRTFYYPFVTFGKGMSVFTI